MANSVEISFDCLPLRTVSRVDIPLDASPAFRGLCERIKGALERHGAFNTYYLYNARAVFQLTNDPQRGRLEFAWEGTLFTSENDTAAARADLQVELRCETCEWLTEPVVNWFHETVRQAALAEFDRYIAAGDLQLAIERAERLRAAADQAGGFLGMYL